MKKLVAVISMMLFAVFASAFSVEATPYLNINLDPATPQSQILILGTLNRVIGVYNLEADGKGIVVNTIPFQTTNGWHNNFSVLYLYNEDSSLIQQKVVLADKVIFQNLAIQVPANTSRLLYIKADLARAAPAGPATPGFQDNFTIDFDSVVAETDSGEPVKIIGSSGTPSLMFFYRSAIIVDWGSISTPSIHHQADMKFAQVKVTADAAGGTAVLKGLRFRYVSSKASPGASFRTLWVETGYYDEQQNFDIQQGEEGYFLINTHDLAIPSGTSATLNLYGTLPAFINQSGTFSINLAGVNWLEAPIGLGLLLNGDLVPGVPSLENTFTFEGPTPEETPAEGPETPEEPTPFIFIPDTTFTRSTDTDTLSVPIRMYGGGIYGGELKFWIPGATDIMWVGVKAKEGFISLSSIKDDTLLVQVISSDGSPRSGYLGQVKLLFPAGETQFRFNWETEFDVSPRKIERDFGGALTQVRYDFGLTLNPTSFSPRGTTTLRTQNGVPPFRITMPEYVCIVSQTTGVWLLGVEPALWPQGQTSVIPEVTVTDSRNAKRSISFTVTAIMGDVDVNGEITIRDALAILEHLLGGELNSYQMVTADFDSNGEVTRWDAIAVLREVLGLPPLERLSKSASSGAGEVDKKEVETRARAALKELEGDDSPEAEMLRGMIYGLLEEYGISVDVEESTASPQPQGFQLLQNSPNPFNPNTTIGYDLSQSSAVTLKVYSTTGQEVATLVSGYQEAGHYEVVWDGSQHAAGVYLYRLLTNEFTKTKRMALVR